MHCSWRPRASSACCAAITRCGRCARRSRSKWACNTTRILFTAVLVCSRGAAAHLLVAGGAHAARPAAVARVDAVRAGVPRRSRAGLTWYPRDRTVAFVYFVALSSANLYLISMFWSAMADVWRPGSREALLRLRRRRRQRRRAPRSATRDERWCTNRARRRSSSWPARSSWDRRCWHRWRAASLRRAPDGERVPDAAIPVGGRAVDDLARLVRTPYLLGIAGIIVAGQIIGGIHVQRAGQVRRRGTTHSLADRAALFARMEFYVNLLSLVFQAGVVTWLTRRGSVRAQPVGHAGADRRRVSSCWRCFRSVDGVPRSRR